MTGASLYLFYLQCVSTVRDSKNTVLVSVLEGPPKLTSQFNWFWISWANGTIAAGCGNRTGNWQTTYIYFVDPGFSNPGFSPIKYMALSGKAAASVARWIFPYYYRPPGSMIKPAKY